LPEIHPALRMVDVIILHELILKNIFHTTDIGYEMDIGSALDKVNGGEFAAAFSQPHMLTTSKKAALLL
jgi:hypothetical protein